ncbi:MAG: tripartite tricarboxylate transporter substrate binding protein [Betaproteobacteria bacterium]|nr:tripartite tricarboxylate transporter substrate binding protein [Betaproteobacteria bacterium]
MIRGIAAALLALFLPAGALAQAWPAKPVRIIVSTGPGLATDIMARLMSDRLSKNLAQQFVVENIAGAAGILGAQAAARATPDGYTFYFAPASALATNQFLFKSLQYDSFRDFTPVAMVCDTGPFVITIQPELPVKSLPELFAYAKANPGKLSYAFDVSSGYAAIIGQLINRRTNAGMTEVPYKATAQALQDTMTGRTQLMIGSIAASDAFVKAGKLRRIAVSSEKRYAAIPDVPAIAETISGFNIDGWFAMVAPTGTPAPIVQRFNREIDAVLKDAEVLQRINQFGLGTSGAGTPQSTGDFIRTQRDRWAGIVRELDIQPQ